MARKYEPSPLRRKVIQCMDEHPEWTVDDMFKHLYANDNTIRIHHVQNAWRAEWKERKLKQMKA